jgi:hypothetical protein
MVLKHGVEHAVLIGRVGSALAIVIVERAERRHQPHAFITLEYGWYGLMCTFMTREKRAFLDNHALQTCSMLLESCSKHLQTWSKASRLQNKKRKAVSLPACCCCNHL